MKVVAPRLAITRTPEKFEIEISWPLMAIGLVILLVGWFA